MTEHAGSRWVQYLLIVIVALLCVPLVVMYLWLLESAFAKHTYGIVPSGFTLSNWRFFREGFTNMPSIWRITFNTLIFAAVVTVAEVFFASLTGYALSRMKFPGRRIFLSFTLVLHAFPAVTLLIAIFYVLLVMGLYDTLLGVILVKAALELPLGVWIMKGFFDNISWDMEMSALVDGCSRFRTWWEVLIPNIRPGIAALSIFAFLSGWSEFLLPYIFTSSFENFTLSVLLKRLVGDFRFVDYGLLTAAGLYYMLPVVLFFIFTQEYLLNIYAGGTKGTQI